MAILALKSGDRGRHRRPSLLELWFTYICANNPKKRKLARRALIEREGDRKVAEFYAAHRKALSQGHRAPHSLLDLTKKINVRAARKEKNVKLGGLEKDLELSRVANTVPQMER